MVGAADMASISQLQARWPSILFHIHIRLGSLVQEPCSNRPLDADFALTLLQCQDHWHQFQSQIDVKSLEQLKLGLISSIVQMQY